LLGVRASGSVGIRGVATAIYRGPDMEKSAA
jgi:hypothetical protein